MPDNIKSTTIDKDEVAKFTAMADEWWDENGKFKPLHIFNPVRVKYIKDNIIKHLNIKINDQLKPLNNIKILDIGCGGGLLSEPLARLGAEVTAIDASEKNIKIAKLHAKNNNLDINYINITAEELLEKLGKHNFDIVLNMEVIEHVANVEDFCKAVAMHKKENGLIFTATINRTLKSYALAIIGAEYILRWLPIGTHDWKKFLKPSEIDGFYAKNNLKLLELDGVSYNPLTKKWSLSGDVDVNYILVTGS